MVSGPYTAWSRGRLTFRAVRPFAHRFPPCWPPGCSGTRPGALVLAGHSPRGISTSLPLTPSRPPRQLPRLDRATPPSAVHALTLLRVRPARAGGSVVPAAAGPVLSTDTWGSVGVCQTSGDSRAGVRDACQRGGGRALRTSVNGAGMGPMLPIPITYDEPL